MHKSLQENELDNNKVGNNYNKRVEKRKHTNFDINKDISNKGIC